MLINFTREELCIIYTGSRQSVNNLKRLILEERSNKMKDIYTKSIGEHETILKKILEAESK